MNADCAAIILAQYGRVLLSISGHLRLRMLINNQYFLSFSLRLSFTETAHLIVNRARFIRAGFFQLALPNIP